MKPLHKQSVTLLELLIAISLLGILVLAFTSIDLFSRYHVRTADFRAQLQNKASTLLEHMSKEIAKAIGSTVIPGQEPVDLTNISGDTAIRVYIDYNQDGQRNIGDRWIAYRYSMTTGNPNEQYQIWYYPNYVTPASPYEVIADRIVGFVPSVTENYVSVVVAACWDPVNAATCGTPDNPSVAMTTSIKMPAVSTH